MTSVLDYAWPILTVIFVWWASTGLIFVLNGLRESTYRISLLGAMASAALATLTIALTCWNTTPQDATIAFISAITVWGLIEMSFLMGFVTGPRRAACPEKCAPRERLIYACAAIVHHEIALLAAMLSLAFLVSGAPNQTAFWTFAILWLMRLSTKVNIFLGVPNTAADLLPHRISYLKSYFRTAPMNLAFPISITAATAATGWLVVYAANAPQASFERASSSILATLCALGLIEHWFLVLPLRVDRLWAMALDASPRGTTHTPPLPQVLRGANVIDLSPRKPPASPIAACVASGDA